uniref:Polybromo 1 n=1 Tax=Ciona savignyi TaxID=51511 RepID=H2ZED9_CIOSA
IYDVIKDHEDSEGHLVADTFMKLPSKRYHPDYHEKIVDPIDLGKIGQRIRMDEYRDIEILTTDIQLMISNAKKYYDAESEEYSDACKLWDLYLTTKARLADNVKPEESKSRPGRKVGRNQLTIQNQIMKYIFVLAFVELKALYEAIVTETDEDGRVIAEMFMQLPDKTNLEYYQLIKEPIDFLMIGDRMEENYYKSVIEFEKDVTLLVKNAKAFNDPISQAKVVSKVTIFIKNGYILQEKPEKVDLHEASVLDFHEHDYQVNFIKYRTHIYSGRWKSVGGLGMSTEGRFERLTALVLILLLCFGYQSIYEQTLTHPPNDQALLYNEVVNYRNNIGHTIADPFVRLPNKRFYPTYYEEIDSPISLKMIRKKILSKKYDTCHDMARDFQLLFSNAMSFNVSHSLIHKDALTLKEFMESRLQEFATKEENSDRSSDSMGEDDDERTKKVEVLTLKYYIFLFCMIKTIFNNITNYYSMPELFYIKRTETLRGRLRLLYETVLDAEDEEGREIIMLFLEKPSKKDYPDYYKLIVDPIDMRTIDKKIRQERYTDVTGLISDFCLMFNNARQYNEPGSQVYLDANALEKLLLEKNKELGPLPVQPQLATPGRTHKKHAGGHYTRLDEMLADLLLMFENACIYNEPGSVIYKDALLLQKVAVETFHKLEAPEEVPRSQQLVHEILMNLFMSLMNHQDETGRCYSDSLMLLDQKASGTSMETGLQGKVPFLFPHTHVDVLQSFATLVKLEVVVKMYPSYFKKNIIFLHQLPIKIFFICPLKKRALNVTRKLNSYCLTPTKLSFPFGLKSTFLETIIRTLPTNKLSIPRALVYKAGDFVYVEDPDKQHEKHIVCIEKLYIDDVGEQRIYGPWFLTAQSIISHFPGKKFMEKEVFKSDYYNTIPVKCILGRCHVMLVKDYFRMKPAGFKDEDVYVCESRFLSKTKSFKRAKSMQLPANDTPLIARETPLSIVRVPSGLGADPQLVTQGVDATWSTDVIDKDRENIKTETQNPHSEATYYIQYFANGMWVKLGDCLYVRNPGGKPKIARVERLWTDNNGNVWFHGPWFVRPESTEHEPNRMFFNSFEDTVLLSDVEGKCMVLSGRDYSACRPTEIPETDIYVYESKYFDKIIKKMKGVKRYVPTHKVVDDEYYYFKKPFTPENVLSPILLKMVAEDVKQRQIQAVEQKHQKLSMNEVTSILQTDLMPQPQFLLLSPNQKKKFLSQTKNNKTTPPLKKKGRVGHSTGYILFASHCHPKVRADNPDLPFGDISKLVGEEWRNLDEEEKHEYEEKAREKMAIAEAEGRLIPRKKKKKNGDEVVTPTITMAPAVAQFQQPGQYTGIVQGTPQTGYNPTMPAYSQTPTGIVYPAQQIAPAPATIAERHRVKRGPLFLQPPPKAQRIMHSEAYLKYIEGLEKGSKTLSNWKKTLSVKENDVVMSKEEVDKLPVHWLANGKARHETTKSALWALRDLMLKDAFAIKNSL